MSKLSNLVQVSAKEKSAIFEHYSITEEEFNERINSLKEWLNQCEHLPKENNDNKLKLMLLNAKLSLEKAKRSLEGYYRIRTKYSNGFFDKFTPGTKEYLESKELVKTVIMPKLTPDLCRITIFKVNDPFGEAPDAFFYHIPVLMMAELRITEDICLSNILIVDMAEYSWKNFVKYTPAISQKLVDMLHSVNLRIKTIYLVNISSILDPVMRVIKQMLPGKILQKIVVLKSDESLKETIPIENLPKDYGGTEKSIDELYEEWCKEIEQSSELFDKLLTAKSTAKIELDPFEQDLFGCGTEGTFRKLVLD